MIERSEGVIVSWIAAKGFGFIRPDAGGNDVVVHANDIEDEDTDVPTVGSRVSYVVGPAA